MLKTIVPLTAGLVIGGAVAAFAAGGDYEGSGSPYGGTLYDRIYARYSSYGHEVREQFRDGPCTIRRHWERDGDFEEKIECEGPPRR